MIRSLKVFSVVLILWLLMGIDAYAADYTVNIHGHYRHPVTGVIEDSGGEEKEALGQSMVDRIMSSEAYYEDADGDSYLTFTLTLMNSISDLSFEIDNGGSYSSTSYERIFDGDDVSDIRVRTVSKDTVLRAKCFVEPMGRNVVFYISCSNFTPGNNTPYPSLVDHTADEEEAEEAVEEPIADNGGNVADTAYPEDVGSGVGVDNTGTGTAGADTSSTGTGAAAGTGTAETSAAQGQKKETLAKNADGVIDNADGLYFGDQNEAQNSSDESEGDMEGEGALGNFVLDDSFWMTIFLLFLTANLVAGIILTAFYFAIKTVYDNRRDKKARLKMLFAQKESPYEEEDFTDDELCDFTDDEDFDEEFIDDDSVDDKSVFSEDDEVDREGEYRSVFSKNDKVDRKEDNKPVFSEDDEVDREGEYKSIFSENDKVDRKEDNKPVFSEDDEVDREGEYKPIFSEDDNGEKDVE